MKKSIIYIGLGGLVLYLAFKIKKENNQILVTEESGVEPIPNQGNGTAPLVPPMTVVTPLTDGNGVVVRDEVKDPPAPVVEPEKPIKTVKDLYPTGGIKPSKPIIENPRLGDPREMDFPIGISPILTPPAKPITVIKPISKPIPTPAPPMVLDNIFRPLAPTKEPVMVKPIKTVFEPIIKPISKPLPTPAPPRADDGIFRPLAPTKEPVMDRPSKPMVGYDFGINAPVLETGNLNNFTIRKDIPRLDFSDF